MNSHSDVKASKSWISSLKEGKGSLLRMDSTSHMFVLTYLKSFSANTAHNAPFTYLIIDSHDAPIHELTSGLKFQVVPLVLGWLIVFHY